MTTAPQMVTQLMQQEQERFANACSFSIAPTSSNRRQRQLYVGNMAAGTVTELMLRELFTQVLTQCEGFSPLTGPPVLSVELRGEGTYAFVEFRDEELRETAMLFSGMEFLGRQVKIY